MKFGIIGNGVVGSATAKVWSSVGEVRTWDIDPYKSSHSFTKVAECDYVFVCVPTPGTADVGPLDCSVVMEVAAKLSVFEPKCAVVRSTVNVGTTQQFQEKSGWPTLFWPEFLTMRTAEQDAMNPICNIVGTPDSWGDMDARFAATIKNRFPLHAARFTKYEYAEAAKLFSNAYGAAHVSLMNELAEIAERNGLKWESVCDCLKATGRINETYSQVPGPDGKYGFGGHCFPKDLAATAWMSHGAMPMLHAAIKRNKWDRGRDTPIAKNSTPAPTEAA